VVAAQELYVSVDVEADGRVPGPFSLVSLGACAAAVRSPTGEISVLDPAAHTFYRELRPISSDWDPQALEVSGLTREHLETNGVEPARAMTEFAEWVDSLSRQYEANPVFAAYPLGFDWQFTYYYLLVFAKRSPFGHSAHFDMKTAYALLANSSVRDAVKRNMPRSVLGRRPHTHNALEDAQGQADLLAALLTWRARLGDLPPP
jgi:DNA polymerase III epsilon subunit-like protein